MSTWSTAFWKSSGASSVILVVLKEESASNGIYLMHTSLWNTWHIFVILATTSSQFSLDNAAVSRLLHWDLLGQYNEAPLASAWIFLLDHHRCYPFYWLVTGAITSWPALPCGQAQSSLYLACNSTKYLCCKIVRQDCACVHYDPMCHRDYTVNCNSLFILK